MRNFPAKNLSGRRPLAAGLLAVALALAVSACGSSSSSSSGTGLASATGTAGSTQVQARLNLAKCFRAHGLNVPDPSTSGGAAGAGGIFRTLRNYPAAQVTAARQACQQYFAQAFPRANVSPAQRAQFQQQAVKFAECMRSHGINIPDPTVGTGGGFGGLGRTLRSVDRNSPAFKTAIAACQSLRPRFGGGAGGGGGGAVGGGTGA